MDIEEKKEKDLLAATEHELDCFEEEDQALPHESEEEEGS